MFEKICENCGCVYDGIKRIYVVQLRAPRFTLEVMHCPRCGYVNKNK